MKSPRYCCRSQVVLPCCDEIKHSDILCQGWKRDQNAVTKAFLPATHQPTTEAENKGWPVLGDI